ncbi:MAG: carbonic anhydrase [Hyphomicrobiales bacterium]|nr:MAG: carbonic anhydrase [Hyphomicrobiales bacterium]
MTDEIANTNGTEGEKSSSSERLLVIGGGGHGRVVAEAAHLSAQFSQIVVVDPYAIDSWTLPFCKCVAAEAAIDADPQSWDFVSAVGGASLRKRLFDEYSAKGFTPARVMHPRAIVSPSAYLGRGVVVLAGAVVATLASIEDGVIVNHNAVVEHDCKVGQFAHLAPGSILAGGACLEDKVFLGAAASVRHGVRVGADIVIGNGAAVVADIFQQGVYVGTPASLIKSTSTFKENDNER